jgi:hypothetical protein
MLWGGKIDPPAFSVMPPPFVFVVQATEHGPPNDPAA